MHQCRHLMAYLIVHRSAAGWINSNNRLYDSEADARADIPELAALLERPASTFRITDTRLARHQSQPHLP